MRNIAVSLTRGFTMIELLLALAIGSLLLTSLTQVVMASKATYRLQHGLSEVQGAGRLALDLLSEDIRMSGFSGCSTSQRHSLQSTLTPSRRESLVNNFQNYALEGLDDYQGDGLRYAADRPFANRSRRSQPVAGTDALIVRRPVGMPLHLLTQSTQTPGYLRVQLTTEDAPWDVGDLVLISDCHRGRLFEVSALRQQNGILEVSYTGTWASQEPGFHPGAQLYRLDTHLYYIRQGSRGFGTSLYLKEGGSNNPPQELIEGAEDLQLLYGVGQRRSRGMALKHFLSATQVESGQLWDQVVSVRLHLRLASLEPHLVPTEADGDGRLRRDFTTLVTLRNRAL